MSSSRLLLIIWLCVGPGVLSVFASEPYDAYIGSPKKNPQRHFDSIAAAIAAAPEAGNKPYRIFISPGNYYEKLVVDKPNVQLIGSGQQRTRIHHDSYAGQPKTPGGKNWGTGESGTLIIRAAGFLARDLQVENSFDFPAHEALSDDDPSRVSGTQAVAIMTDIGSDRALFERVTISGYQDTLYTLSGRSLFIHSIIKGHVDFIFGAGSAVFLNSEIVTRPRVQQTDPIGYITAPSTNIKSEFGLVFIACRLTRESGVKDDSMALGRPWHPTTSFPDGRYADPYAIGQAVFLNSWMDAHIKAVAWHPMGGTLKDGSRGEFQPGDARFFEYNSTGPGAIEHPNRRLLIAEQAQRFTPENILGDWQPFLTTATAKH